MSVDIPTQDRIAVIAASCSVLACLILLWTYYRRNSKPVSLKMIATLSAVDCIASLLSILFIWVYTAAGLANHSILKFSCLVLKISPFYGHAILHVCLNINNWRWNP